MSTPAGADRTTFRSGALRALTIAGTGVVIVLALVAILTALRTELPRSPGVMTDSLGPESGEVVEDYLARAAGTLVAVDEEYDDDDEVRTTDPEALRWALISAEQAWSVPEAVAAARDVPRVSGLYVQVPIEGVAMPVTGVTTAEPVTAEPDRAPVFDRGLEQVARRLDSGSRSNPEPSATPAPDGPDAPDGTAGTAGPAGDDRAAAVNALTAARIRSGEPAIIGLVARGTLPQLRAVADRPGVRAVEALPADAVWERFAVRPLQPQQVEAALPLPDSAPVPSA